MLIAMITTVTIGNSRVGMLSFSGIKPGEGTHARGALGWLNVPSPRAPPGWRVHPGHRDGGPSSGAVGQAAERRRDPRLRRIAGLERLPALDPGDRHPELGV